ncbi:arginase, partial [Paenibacillus sp. LMG 31460]
MITAKNNNIAIIGVPLQYGADRKGVDMGPDAIRGSNIHHRLESLGYQIQDIGDIHVNKSIGDHSFQAGEKLKHLNEIKNVNSELCQVVATEMNKGKFPLVLGGDHSIAIGT